MAAGGRQYDAQVRSAARNGRGGPDAALAVLASRQHGVVSREQLLALGMTRDRIRRRLESRRLTRLHRGVYAVGHWSLTRASRELGAVLACGPEALLSHRAAGSRRGLLRGTAPIEVTILHGCKPRAGIVVHETRQLRPDDRDELDGIPITSVARTIVDLAAVLDHHRLTAVVNEAEVRRCFDLTEIERTIERFPGRRGIRRLRQVLETYAEAPGYSESEAERLLRRLCRRYGLPQPGRVFLHGCELDFYWPDARLGVEVDSRTFHGTTRAFEEDRRRDRTLAAHGIQVARVTWRDLSRAPARLAGDLAAIRSRRLT